MNNDTIIKSTLLFLFFTAFSFVSGQGVYFDPAPTDVTTPARLYIDITSGECDCPALQDADPVSNPLYIWAWNPNEQRVDVNGLDVKNGEWGNSNDNLVLQQDPDNPNLWYFDFVGVSLTEFYQVGAATFYDTGLDFLLKEKNGNSPGEGEPEQKSPDINVIPEPLGCFEKICPFPTTFFQDEYFFINYDNNKETISSLQNLGPDECLIWFRISINDGPLVLVQEDTDQFKMNYDGDGQFSLAMIPQDYFNLQDGDILSQMDVYITKPPIQAPPFTAPISLIPGCN